MTTTTASDPPASSQNRFRMTRSRILSSAPPMTMTLPSVVARPGVLEGTLRGSLPNNYLSRSRGRSSDRGDRSGGGVSKIRRRRATLPGSWIDRQEEDRPEREEHDARKEGRTGSVARGERAA